MKNVIHGSPTYAAESAVEYLLLIGLISCVNVPRHDKKNIFYILILASPGCLEFIISMPSEACAALAEEYHSEKSALKSKKLAIELNPVEWLIDFQQKHGISRLSHLKNKTCLCKMGRF